MSVEIFYDAYIETSESFDFNLTCNEIIELANEKIGRKAAGQSLTQEQYSSGRKILNAMVKNWRGKGIHIWNSDTFVMPLHDSNIVLATDGNDYECILNHTSNTRNEPGVGEDWMTYWKLLTTSTGIAWASGTAYLSILNYTLDSNIAEIESIRLRQSDSLRVLRRLSKHEYLNLLDTGKNPGEPNQYYFRRERSPELFLFPSPNSSTDYILEIERKVFPEDFDNGDDYSDFLQEWILPLIDNLAVKLAPAAGVSSKQYLILKKEADESLRDAKTLAQEVGEIRFQPDYYWRQ